METRNNFKCVGCSRCDGLVCLNELPGMGGVNDNTNFKLNCTAWERLYGALPENERRAVRETEVLPGQIFCAPVTGANQNIGFAREPDFYLPYFTAAQNAGCGICVGDGAPDDKLKFGIEAVKTLGTKAAVFIKPYPVAKMIERMAWASGSAEIFGCDIDAYEIVTMRNFVNLEKPTAASLSEFRKRFDLPLAIKGVFTEESVFLVKELKPDIVYVSNHGGRIDTRTGSTADFLAERAKELRNFCGEVWVDGGIRSLRDVQTALYLGASKVAVARPLIAALISDNEGKNIAAATDFLRSLTNTASLS